MSLAAGTYLGTYEVIGSIGAGGMGEVYRARDARLQRDVAIKLLPASVAADPLRRRQFEEEARAAGALNHPNLLTVFDVGTWEGTPYIVCELLQGETLRARLTRGAMPVRMAVAAAQEIAAGLATAHARGIVHRDLKPENIFLTRDGRTKILDFGIATRVSSPPASATATIPGFGGEAVGTAGYMAPEQIRGGIVDQRADLFALGAVLYEMLSGRRVFQGPSAIERLNATLTAEPEPLEIPSVGPGLSRVASRCLEKDVERRFQSASDVAFALEVLSGPAASGTQHARHGDPGRRSSHFPRLQWVALTALTAAAVSAGYLLARAVTDAGRAGEEGTYRALTFRRGYVSAARFVGEDTVVYSAAWDGQPLEIYTASVDRPESRSLGLPSAGLLAASPQGVLAISLGCRWNSGLASCPGTLAEVPITGGSPRELLQDVVAADYSPRGELAIVRRTSRGMTIEQPIGTVRYETSARIFQVRVSPDGNAFAFLEGAADEGVALSVINRGGARRKLATGFSSTVAALAWSGNDAVWVGATRQGHSGIFEVRIDDGRMRAVDQHMSPMALQDRLANGRALLVQTQVRQQLMIKGGMTADERDLSWFDFSVLAGLSRDGRWVLFNEAGDAVSRRRTAYFRGTDGAAAMKVFDGVATALSHAANLALVLAEGGSPAQLMLVPLGPGEPLTLPALETGEYDASYMAFFPDDRRILFYATDRSHGLRAYVQDLPAGKPRAISEEVAQSAYVISPDGQSVLVAHRSAGGVHVRCPVDGSLECTRVRGLESPRDVPIAWSAEGLYVRDFVPGALRSEIRRIDPVRGISTPYRTVQVTDPTGAIGIARVMLAPEAGAHGYVVQRVSGSVVLASGLH